MKILEAVIKYEDNDPINDQNLFDVLWDNRLSLAAKGLYACIAGGICYQIGVDEIDTSDGRAEIEKAFAELVKYGYAREMEI